MSALQKLEFIMAGNVILTILKQNWKKKKKKAEAAKMGNSNWLRKQ